MISTLTPAGVHMLRACIVIVSGLACWAVLKMAASF